MKIVPGRMRNLNMVSERHPGRSYDILVYVHIGSGLF